MNTYIEDASDEDDLVIRRRAREATIDCRVHRVLVRIAEQEMAAMHEKRWADMGSLARMHGRLMAQHGIPIGEL